MEGIKTDLTVLKEADEFNRALLQSVRPATEHRVASEHPEALREGLDGTSGLDIRVVDTFPDQSC